MKQLLIVAWREIVVMLRRPSLYVTTLLLPLISGVLLFGFTFLGAEAAPEPAEAAAGVPAVPSGYIDQAEVITTVPDTLQRNFIEFADEARAAAALEAGTIEAYFVVVPDYHESGKVVRVSPQTTFTSAGAPDTRAFRTLLRANLSGDWTLAQRLEAPLDLQMEVVGEAAGQAWPAPGQGISFALGLLLAFGIFTGGGWLVQAVAEEKENRTLEIVLTSLRPWQIMAGKLLGLGLISLLQLVFWTILGHGLLGVGSVLGQIDSVGIAPTVWGWLFAFFVLGFLLFGAIMMAIGAVGGSIRESSQISGVLALPILAPFWFTSVISQDPDGVLALALSLLPFTAPVTMMLRLGQAGVPLWQLAASIALLVLAVVAAIWLAARLFRATILLAGVRPTPRTVWRLVRGA